MTSLLLIFPDWRFAEYISDFHIGLRADLTSRPRLCFQMDQNQHITELHLSTRQPHGLPLAIRLANPGRYEVFLALPSQAIQSLVDRIIEVRGEFFQFRLPDQSIEREALLEKTWPNRFVILVRHTGTVPRESLLPIIEGQVRPEEVNAIIEPIICIAQNEEQRRGLSLLINQLQNAPCLLLPVRSILPPDQLHQPIASINPLDGDFVKKLRARWSAIFNEHSQSPRGWTKLFRLLENEIFLQALCDGGSLSESLEQPDRLQLKLPLCNDQQEFPIRSLLLRWCHGSLQSFQTIVKELRQSLESVHCIEDSTLPNQNVVSPTGEDLGLLLQNLQIYLFGLQNENEYAREENLNNRLRAIYENNRERIIPHALINLCDEFPEILWLIPREYANRLPNLLLSLLFYPLLTTTLLEHEINNFLEAFLAPEPLSAFLDSSGLRWIDDGGVSNVEPSDFFLRLWPLLFLLAEQPFFAGALLTDEERTTPIHAMRLL